MVGHMTQHMRNSGYQLRRQLCRESLSAISVEDQQDCALGLGRLARHRADVVVLSRSVSSYVHRFDVTVSRAPFSQLPVPPDLGLVDRCARKAAPSSPTTLPAQQTPRVIFGRTGTLVEGFALRHLASRPGVQIGSAAGIAPATPDTARSTVRCDYWFHHRAHKGNTERSHRAEPIRRLVFRAV